MIMQGRFFRTLFRTGIMIDHPEYPVPVRMKAVMGCFIFDKCKNKQAKHDPD
jgi:hypothetical protein